VNSRLRRAALVALLVLGPRGLAGAADASSAAGEYADRALADVLRALQAQGLAIVFTTELVRPEMRVLAEPPAGTPREILEQVLAPHGLEVHEAAGGVLVVARRAPATPAPAIAGTVQARGGGPGLRGARVRVLAGEFAGGMDVETGEDGSFAFAGLEPGTYTLEAVAEGYLEQRVTGVAVSPDGVRRVEIRLHPQPFLEEEIVVRPSRLTLLRERPDSTFALGREEIDSLPHLGDDLFRALSLLPGTAGNDVSAQVAVHGGRRDEVLVLLDGQELYDAYHLKDYDNALSIVPARTLAAASLTTGAYSANLGDRMSAVLDLRTAEPRQGHHYLLGLSVLDVLLSGAGTFAGERGSWLAAGRRGSIDLAADAVGDEHPAFWDLFAKAALLTDLGLVSARLLEADDELEVHKQDAESFERLENDYRATYGWLGHQGSPGPRLLVETLASWSRVERRRGGAGRDEEGGFDLSDRRDLEVLGLAQAFALEAGQRHLQRWGGELRRYDVVLDYAKQLEPEFPVVAPFSPPRATAHAFDRRLRGEHLGLWTSERSTLFAERLTAELGLRYDRHSATDDTLWSPRLNLAWRLGPRSVARAAWGRFFQSQRPYELQVEDGEEGLRRAERSAHWVLGYETLLPPQPLGLDALRLELYRREIDDPRPRYENLLEPLNIFQEAEPDRVRIAPRETIAEGLEILLRGRRRDRLDWWLAYAWARAEDRLAGGTGRRVPRSLDQRHTLALDVNWRLPRRWNLNLAWRYHSGWPTTPVEARLVQPPDPDEPDEPGDPEESAAEPELVAVFGPLNSRRLPAYHRLDLRASRRYDLRRGHLTLYVDVQNLYDRRNLAGFDVSLDEEAGAVELEEEDWPGIFPSLGLTWEF
jgi:outer membrane receptor protein involved in Fe transport